jgi:predicted glycoside hydrolase/deacetylase ChbG (UPF0249 family)
MKRLIVTADDFGLTKSVNVGIARARRDGIVTYLSLIPTGDAFSDAIRLLREMGVKEAGAHLAVTETSPLTKLRPDSALVGRDGRFLKNHIIFFANLFLKRIDRSALYSELKAQLELVKDAGIDITCLSSHEHIHMEPSILAIFLRLAKEYCVPSIRLVGGDICIAGFGAKIILRETALFTFAATMKRSLDTASVKHTDRLLGFLDSGNIYEDVIIKLLKCVKDGSTELVCHPGILASEIRDRYTFHKNCEKELTALTSPRVKKLIEEESIHLTTFSQLFS